MDANGVPLSLRRWFLIHFIADIIFAVPLLFFPVIFLSFWGFDQVNTLTARLVGAALAGIGGNSFFMHKGSIESFDTMLTLKIIWSGAAIVGISLSIMEGGPASLYIFLLIFLSFSVIWIYYKFLLTRRLSE